MKLKDFTTLELMLSALLLIVFIITIPLFVLSAKESLKSKGNSDVLSPHVALNRAKSS